MPPRRLVIAGTALAAALALLVAVAPLQNNGGAIGRGLAKVRHAGPWLILLAVALSAWELVTAKFLVLPRPFFAPPQALLDVYVDDWPRLGESVLRQVIGHTDIQAALTGGRAAIEVPAGARAVVDAMAERTPKALAS